MSENASPASALIGDPAAYGRVGEDGTVYVITDSGERAVGSYPGKSSEEALAYFVRKFEMAASEIALLGARIKSGAMVPDEAVTAVNKLRAQLENFNGVGNLLALRVSLEQLPSLIEAGRGAYAEKKAAERAAKDSKRAETLAAKERIVVDAEALANSESWKSSSEKLKELLDEWKKAPRLDKATDAALWKRFSSSRNRFDKRRRQHFAQLISKQSEVKQTKESIVLEAESLRNSRDWVATANKFKELMAKWKVAGRGKHSDDTKLWARFKAAQDEFFLAKKADLDKRGVAMDENLSKREALLAQYEALVPVSDHQAARKKFRDLDDQWRKIGMTDRKKRDAMESRIKKVNEAIREVEQSHARKSDPTAKARANDVVTQLQAAIENYDAQALKAENAGNAKRAAELREAAEARRGWLAEAQKGLAEFAN
ncbi:MAG: DUF349 domain-containing protein [Actinobacteria bacterium]|nr:DUF349 domain-containing protein [Actinomycetota bacterium]